QQHLTGQRATRTVGHDPRVDVLDGGAGLARVAQGAADRVFEAGAVAAVGQLLDRGGCGPGVDDVLGPGRALLARVPDGAAAQLGESFTAVRAAQLFVVRVRPAGADGALGVDAAGEDLAVDRLAVGELRVGDLHRGRQAAVGLEDPERGVDQGAVAAGLEQGDFTACGQAGGQVAVAGAGQGDVQDVVAHGGLSVRVGGSGGVAGAGAGVAQ